MTDEIAPPGTKTCPWCAEEIRAEAKKCKFCGEFLTDARPNTDKVAMGAGSDSENIAASNALSVVGPVWVFSASSWQCVAHQEVACSKCLEIIEPPATGWEGQLFSVSNVTEVQSSATRPYGQGVHPPEVEAILKLASLRDSGKISVTEFEAARAPLLAALPKNYRTTKSQQPPSGVRMSHGTSCPRCGGTRFTAKRSNKGKVNRAGITSDERARLKQLERENKDLKRANAILKDASIFFATELDGQTRR